MGSCVTFLGTFCTASRRSDHSLDHFDFTIDPRHFYAPEVSVLPFPDLDRTINSTLDSFASLLLSLHPTSTTTSTALTCMVAVRSVEIGSDVEIFMACNCARVAGSGLIYCQNIFGHYRGQLRWRKRGQTYGHDTVVTTK